MANARRIAFVILLLLGLAGAVSIPFFVGIDKSLEAFQQAGLLCTVIYVLNSSLAYLIPAFSWWLLLKAEKLPISLPDCIRASLMGFPISLITPSMYLGGEPVKAIFISTHYKVSGSKVAATMTVAKFMESIGLLLFMLISVGGVIMGGNLLAASQTIAICIVMGFLVALIVTIMVAYGKGFKPVTRIVGLLRYFRIKPQRLVLLRRMIAAFEESVHRSIYTHWKVFLVAQLICLLSAFSILFRPYLFIVFSPTYASKGFDLDFLFAVFVITNVVNLIQITPGGLGTFDGAMIMAFELTGYGKQEAVAFNIMNRIYDVVLFTIGTWLLAHYGLMRFLKPKKQEEAPAESVVKEADSPTSGPDG